MQIHTHIMEGRMGITVLLGKSKQQSHNFLNLSLFNKAAKVSQAPKRTVYFVEDRMVSREEFRHTTSG